MRPLIQRLLRTQQRAQERLEESNRGIIRHVEEQTTQHIYNLLRADKMNTDGEQKREEQAAARMGEVLVSVSDRPKALAFFLDSLSPTDRAQLRRILKNQKGR